MELVWTLRAFADSLGDFRGFGGIILRPHQERKIQILRNLNFFKRFRQTGINREIQTTLHNSTPECGNENLNIGVVRNRLTNNPNVQIPIKPSWHGDRSECLNIAINPRLAKSLKNLKMS